MLLKIPKNKLVYFLVALPLVMALGCWASIRDVASDTETYYQFYRSLIDNGIVGFQSFQSFEPFYVIVSYVIGCLFRSESGVHLFWVTLFYLVTLKSLLLLWPQSLSASRYSFVSLICFAFVSINYIDPQIIYFLTRQYVASSFIVLAIACIYADKSPVYPLVIAVLIHFASLPMAFVVFLFSGLGVYSKKVVVLLICVFVVLLSVFGFYFIEVYSESIKLKFSIYAYKVDGDVSLLDEVKLFFYWGLAVLYFKSCNVRLMSALILIYVLYLMSMSNELAHLRYYKYLVSMSWPGFLIVINLARMSYAYIYASALCLRIYKYLIVFCPEASSVYLIKLLVLNIVSNAAGFFVFR